MLQKCVSYSNVIVKEAIIWYYFSGEDDLDNYPTLNSIVVHGLKHKGPPFLCLSVSYWKAPINISNYLQVSKKLIKTFSSVENALSSPPLLFPSLQNYDPYTLRKYWLLDEANKGKDNSLE